MCNTYSSVNFQLCTLVEIVSQRNFIIMKSNEVLQRDVQDAIKWEPLLNAAKIGVTAKDGIVTLTGIVDSFAKKTEAEDAAKKVAGVKVVVEKIEIKFGNWGKTSDTEIATEVINAFKWNWQIPSEKVEAKVENGWVTLDGVFQWNYQRDAAKNAVKDLLGVKGVSNNITIKSENHDDIEKKSIELALERNWATNGLKIMVKATGHNVTLSGTVDSWYQKEEAGRNVFNAPGVWKIENDLVIDYN